MQLPLRLRALSERLQPRKDTLGDEEPEPEVVDLSGLRVLVAEANAINQRLVKAMLTRVGVEHSLVENGALAVEAVRDTAFDVVLMDVQMPTMDGVEAARLMRKLPGPRPWIIALTANVMWADRQRCIDAGMDGFVSKPFTMAALRNALAQAPGVTAS